MKAVVTTIALILLTILVLGLGGFVFRHLEVHNEEATCEQDRNEYMQLLNVTTALLYEDYKKPGR